MTEWLSDWVTNWMTDWLTCRQGERQKDRQREGLSSVPPWRTAAERWKAIWTESWGRPQWLVGWLAPQIQYCSLFITRTQSSIGPRILYPLGIIDSPRVTSELQIKKIRSFMTNTNHLLSGSNGNTLCIDVLPFGHLANTFTQSRLQWIQIHEIKEG